MKYDLIVIGGGPAGYVGAIRASQLGKKVACVEMDRAGGTCLNWGCIPTKSLIRNAELYHLLKHKAGEFGLQFDNLSFDWSKVIGRSRKVSDRLAGGIEFLFKKNKIDYIRGKATLVGSGNVEVEGADGAKQTLESAKVLLATGCATRDLPGFPFDGRRVIGSHDAMILQEQPKDIIIIGAGAIGVEFAYFFNSFGTRVTIVEMLPNLLPVEDTDVSVALEKSFKRQGLNLLLGTKVTGTKTTEAGAELTVENAQGTQTVSAAVCLVAIGVKPLLPPGAALQLTERGYIKVDARYQTSLREVYAAGDIIGPPWLAHVASWEAIQAVEGMFTNHAPKKVELYPGCTYCQPQVASVGLTERAAKEKGLKYKTGVFPFQASGKAQAVGESEGFVKLIVGEEHGEILGAHIIGSEATEMIAEMGLAISLEATLEDIETTIHAHPTLSEAIHEAAGAAQGRAVHI
ncbi:MAG: dihydrolipoyl dehydrogenase [Verrucomicrobiales bacterium]|nr:dihydrolipoyl dehydrogenase [Verrucomicrobiales bacterium]